MIAREDFVQPKIRGDEYATFSQILSLTSLRVIAY